MQEAEEIINALFDDAQEATEDATAKLLSRVQRQRLPQVELVHQGGRVIGASFVRQDVTPAVTASFPNNRPSKAVREVFKRRNN